MKCCSTGREYTHTTDSCCQSPITYNDILCFSDALGYGDYDSCLELVQSFLTEQGKTGEEADNITINNERLLCTLMHNAIEYIIINYLKSYCTYSELSFKNGKVNTIIEMLEPNGKVNKYKLSEHNELNALIQYTAFYDYLVKEVKKLKDNEEVSE